MLDKGFEECCGMIAERTKERMKWVWEEDLDATYEKVRDGEGGVVVNGAMNGEVGVR